MTEQQQSCRLQVLTNTTGRIPWLKLFLVTKWHDCNIMKFSRIDFYRPNWNDGGKLCFHRRLFVDRGLRAQSLLPLAMTGYTFPPSQDRGSSLCLSPPPARQRQTPSPLHRTRPGQLCGRSGTPLAFTQEDVFTDRI